MVRINRWLKRLVVESRVTFSSSGAAGWASTARCVVGTAAARAVAELAPSLSSSRAEVVRLRRALADPQTTREAARLMSEQVGQVNAVLLRAAAAAGQVSRGGFPFTATRKASVRAHRRFTQARAEGVLIHDALLHVVETGEVPITHDPLKDALSRYAGQIRNGAAVATYRSAYGNETIFSGTNEMTAIRADVNNVRALAGQLIISAEFIDTSVRTRRDAIAAGASTPVLAPAPRCGQPSSKSPASGGLALVGGIASDLRKRLDECAKLTDDVKEGLERRVAHQPDKLSGPLRIGAAVATAGTSEFLTPKDPVRCREAVPLLRECFVAAGFAGIALGEVIKAATAASRAKDLPTVLRHLDVAVEQATVAQTWCAAHDALLNRVAPVAADAKREIPLTGSWSRELHHAIDRLIVGAAESVNRGPALTALTAAVAATVDDVTTIAST